MSGTFQIYQLQVERGSGHGDVGRGRSGHGDVGRGRSGAIHFAHSYQQ